MNLDQKRSFGRTGVSVTPLAVGTASWGTLRTGESEAGAAGRIAEIADRFFAGTLRTNIIDTSNMYGEARSEAEIGRAIARARGVGSGLVLQTKLDRRIPGDRFDGERMWESLRESLDRLGLERLQVLYLHDPEVIGFDAAMAPGGPVEAIVAMKKQGIADAIGISGGPVDMLQRFVETDLFDALVTHNRWTLLDRSADALLNAATLRGVGVTNGAPYGAGILTGDPRFAESYGYKPLHPRTGAALKAIQAVCRDADVPLAAAAIQFSLRDPRIHSTIVGVSELARWEEAVANAEVEIPSGFWEAVDELAPPAEVALDRI
jgi:D-threo-aldose 1-dehydrogenase